MKRLIAIMLCMISILSILSVSAFAAVDPYIEYKPWAGQALEWAIEEKVTAATGWADFRPAKELSRAEVVTFLYAYKGKPENNGDEGNPFCDINPGDWWYDAAIWAYYKGYVAGGFDENGNRCFMPDTKCTYAHLVTMLYALAGKPSVSTDNYPYDHVPEDEYYYKPLKWCKQQGIIDKIPAKYFPQGGIFNPDVRCTRVIFVTMLYNFHKIDTKYISPRVLRMVNLAVSEDGNNYARYGVQNHWCAAFVSWCAMSAGLADTANVTFNSDGSVKPWSKIDPSFSYNYPVLRNADACAQVAQFALNNSLYVSKYYYKNTTWNKSFEKDFGEAVGNAVKNNTQPMTNFTPRRGDVVFFAKNKPYSDSDGYHGITGHVGIVINAAKNPRTGKVTITVVEGNTEARPAAYYGEEFWKRSKVAIEEYTFSMTDGDTGVQDSDTRYIVGFGRIR